MKTLTIHVRPFQNLDWKEGTDGALCARFHGLLLGVQAHDGEARFNEPPRYCTWGISASPDYDLFEGLLRSWRDTEGHTALLADPGDIEAAKRAAYDAALRFVEAVVVDVERSP